MRRPPQARVALEALEDRCCPSAAAHLVGGSLVVNGSTPNLTVTEVAQGIFRVQDAQAVRGQFRVTQDVEIDMATRDSDRITLNLNSHTAPGNVRINLGQDSPGVSVYGGTIHGNLSIEGSAAHADVVLGTSLPPGPYLPPPPLPTPVIVNPDGPPEPWSVVVGLPAPNPGMGLVVAGTTYVRLDNGGSALRAAPWVQLTGALTIGGVSTIWFGPGSSVGHDAAIIAGNGPTSLQLDAPIGGRLEVIGGTGKDSLHIGGLGHIGGDLLTTAVGSVILDPGSTVGGSAIFTDGDAGGNVMADGRIGGNLDLLGGNAADVLSVARTAAVGHDVFAWLGAGANSVTLRGVVTGDLNVFGGSGNDSVSLGGIVGGQALASLGDGNNSFALVGTVGAYLSGNTTALEVFTGAGGDSVGFASTAVVHGGLLVSLGAGNDSAGFADGFKAASGVIDGGTGMDGFDGIPPSGVSLTNFEFGVA